MPVERWKAVFYHGFTKCVFKKNVFLEGVSEVFLHEKSFKWACRA